jgi:hypothetical protein
MEWYFPGGGLFRGGGLRVVARGFEVRAAGFEARASTFEGDRSLLPEGSRATAGFRREIR